MYTGRVLTQAACHIAFGEKWIFAYFGSAPYRSHFLSDLT